MTNLTYFRKTVETGVDPRVILVSLWCGGTGGGTGGQTYAHVTTKISRVHR